jgi:hypothetical protein
MGYDGTLVHNIMKHTVKIQPYRADGLAAKTYSVDIGPDEWRLVNNDHIGDADYFFLVAFMNDSEIPERIGVTQGTWAKSGSVGFSIQGLGGITIGGGEGGTKYYSSSMAAAVVKLTQNPETGRFESNEKFLLEAADGTVSFDPGATKNEPTQRLQMVVWRMLYAPDQKSRPSDNDMKGW